MSTLRTLNPRKAKGYDYIPVKLLRIAYKELSIQLTNVFNNSIYQCVFPDNMKCGELSPVYTKRDILIKCNSRSFSISQLYPNCMNLS